MQRPVCYNCNSNPAAINYVRNTKKYYRKLCDSCSRKARKLRDVYERRASAAGYKKSNSCEQCSFKPVLPGQLTIFRIDGNMNNVKRENLKTVCLNCNYELSINGWQHGDLLEDL